MVTSSEISTIPVEEPVQGGPALAHVKLKSFNYSALPDHLAMTLRQDAERIRQDISTTTRGLIDIGRGLNAAKRMLEHGQFVDWVETEIGIRQRTAQRYMSLASFAEGKNDIVSYLPLNVAYKLAARSTPPDLVEIVLQQAEAGQPVSEREVNHLLRERKRTHEERERSVEPPLEQVAASAQASQPSTVQATQDRGDGAEEKARILLDKLGPEHAGLIVDMLHTDAAGTLMCLKAVLDRHALSNSAPAGSEPMAGSSRLEMPGIPAFLDRRTGAKGDAV